jgi:peptide/nickel transport system permease protein
VSETLAPAERLPFLGATRKRRVGVPILVGAAFLVAAIVVVMGVFGHLVAPQSPSAQDLAEPLAGPSSGHWLGTDALGRDVLSRVIAGARTALVGPLVIAAGAVILGNLLGLVAGYRGKLVDATIMRWVDFMWSMPALLVIIVVAGALNGGYWTAVVLLLLLSIPFDARITRAATLEQVQRPYVEAARTLGLPDWRVMFLHVWPNVSTITIPNAFLDFAGALVALSTLSFLGLGSTPGTPDWGLMVAEGQDLLFTNPVGVLAPCVMIVLAAMSMNLIGDWLHERLASRGATR